MNKQEYLLSLRRELDQRNVTKVHDIMTDYEEHFSHALKSGKDESEIVDKLGAPDLIAKAYETESMINKAKASSQGVQWGLILSSLGRLVILAPFNFIFMFIPAIVTFSLLVAGWSVAGAFGAAGIGILTAMPTLAGIAGGSWALVAAVFTSFGVFGLATIGAIIMYFITKSVAIGVIGYLQWNLKFILAK